MAGHEACSSALSLKLPLIVASNGTATAVGIAYPPTDLFIYGTSAFSSCK